MAGKVLVVDDEDTLRLTIKTRLSSGGFDTEDAVDGEDALEKLKQQVFDVVLLDINMPRMDGITALGVISELYPSTDVIMLTGFADFSTAIECLKKGAKDYLVKPIDTTELITRMRSLQRARSSEAALEESRRAHAVILMETVLARILRLQDELDTLAGKSGKEHSATLKAVQDLAAKIAEEVKQGIDPKQLRSSAVNLSTKTAGVEKLAEHAAARVAGVAKARGVKVEYETEKKLPKMEMDAAKVEEAVTQAASACVVLSPKGGSVTLHVGQVKRKEENLEIRLEAGKVGEHGSRIAELLGREFETVGSSMTKVDNASALLLCARLVIEAHGGEVQAESTKGGLTVRMLLPLQRQEQ